MNITRGVLVPLPLLLLICHPLAAGRGDAGAPVAQSAASTAVPANPARDCADCPEMMIVPAGSVTMGSPEDEPGRNPCESPQRRVGAGRFAIGKFDVTRGQWAAFVVATKRPVTSGCAWIGGATTGRLDPAGAWNTLQFPQDDSHPVVCVTWQDAQD